MSQQIQCPNCGGYKVNSVGPYFEDPITHKRLGANSVAGCILPLIIIVCGLIIGANAGRGLDQASSTAIGNYISYGGIVLAIIVLLIARAIKRAKLKQYALSVYNCDCEICGRKFNYTK